MEDKTNWFDQIIQMLISILAKIFLKQDLGKAIEAAVPTAISVKPEIKAPEPIIAAEPIRPQSILRTPITPLSNVEQQLKIQEARNKAKADIIAKIHEPKPLSASKSELIPLRPKNKKELKWIPWALNSKVAMPTQGKYKFGYPQGLVLHWTSGRSFHGLKDAENNIIEGANSGLGFLIIARDGELIQPFSLERWTYHAGKSFWPGLGDFVHTSLLGLEVCNAGKLIKRGSEFVSWFGEVIPDDEVFHQETDRGNIKAGYYHKYTPKQMATIKRLILWLKENDPDVFKIELVLGHDEVAPGRKTDPGGALMGRTMRELRIELIEEYKQLQGGVLHG